MSLLRTVLLVIAAFIIVLAFKSHFAVGAPLGDTAVANDGRSCGYGFAEGEAPFTALINDTQGTRVQLPSGEQVPVSPSVIITLTEDPIPDKAIAWINLTRKGEWEIRCFKRRMP